MIKIRSSIFVPPSEDRLAPFYYRKCPDKVMSYKHFQYRNQESNFNIDYNQYLEAYSEHDALHFLLRLGFDDDGEIKVAKAERHCNVGWHRISKRLNGFHRLKTKYCPPEGLNKQVVLDTAARLRELY